MKHFFFIFICFVCAVTSFAQTHPLEMTKDRTVRLLKEGNRKEGYQYWLDNSEAYKTDTLYASASAVVAEYFMNAGHFSEAEVLLNNAEQALSNKKDDSSWWWKNWGYVLSKKAELYVNLGDFKLSRTYGVDAKIAYEYVSYKGPDYAMNLIVLAISAYHLGHYVLSRTFATQALQIAFLVYMKDESTYSNLAYIMRESCEIEAGLGYYDNAINALKSLNELNQTHKINDRIVDYYLGMLYVNSGDYEKAVKTLSPFYDDCEILQLKIQSGINLLYAKQKLGHNDIGKLAYDVAKFQADNISRMFSFMSDREKEKWWRSDQNRIISIADAILLKSGIENVNGIIANNEMFSKGLLLRSSNMLKDAALHSTDKQIVEDYYTLEGLRSMLAGISNRAEQGEFEQRISALEKELSRKLDVSLDEVLSWQDVASSFDAKEVGIEFVRFEDLDQTDKADYYAIVVKNNIQEPKIIHLFEESALKYIVDNKDNRPTNKFISELYETKCDELYNMIWSKLEKEVKGAKTIYYSPVGLLHSISLQALAHRKQYLSEKYVMHLVSSLASIPHMKNTSPNVSKSAVIYGGVMYDANESELIQASRSYSRGTTSNSWQSELGEVRSGWKRLPGTEIEAKEIGTILTNKGYRVDVLSGVDANEESFKSLSGKEIHTIHVATHGFFLSDQKEIKRNAFLNPTMLESVGRIDPMLRSGLLFAGANRAWLGKRTIDGIEDGILTAKEIAGLNFSKVGLIVLSACQTGLGDVEANEGVYGLQRAFKLAGAETIIMSLWEVDDQATSLLMRTFYEKYLIGDTKDAAFRDAINKVRNYKDENGDKPYSSPYYWAAFIMLD